MSRVTSVYGILSLMSILIIEDCESLRQLYKMRLKDFTLSFASDGIEALEILENLSPRVIILDINMPRMDGFSFLRKKKHHCPVIVITNIMTMIPYEEWEELHIKEYLIKKDITLKSVEDIVKKIISIDNYQKLL